MSIRNLIIAVTLLLIPASAKAEGIVMGDSIGVGVSWAAKAAGVRNLAKLSVAIYSGQIMEQLRQAKEGDTVFLSLGTNDAVGGALDVKAKVAAIVAEADKLGVKLVWIGPPCVLKPWEKYSKELDGILAAELEGKAKYVSTQTEEFCSPQSPRRRGRSLYYGGLYTHVAEGRRGRRLLLGRRRRERRARAGGAGAEPQARQAPQA